jgi:hypothetical protein
VLWRPTEHEPVVEQEWNQSAAQDAMTAIVSDAEASAGDGLWPVHPLDELDDEGPVASLYLGSAGTIWALHELGSSLGLRALIGRALEHYRAEPDFAEQAHPPSLWMGETGLLLVAAKLAAPAADTERLRQLILENRDHPTWELMWGSPGTMLAARERELDREWQDSAALLFEHWEKDSGLWTQTLYGRVRKFLGPAHGFSGGVHALRGHVSDDVLSARVAPVLDRHAIGKNNLVNWPPTAEPSEPVASTIRVQWCHGAPGIIATLGDLMPRELALAGGNLIWRAGPLRKGPGLCHGTAGNGYAFLKLFALTGDEHWLDRARRFAMHAIAQVESERDRLGQGRYSLWTGDLGVAIYLRSCIRADPAFPTLDFW